MIGDVLYVAKEGHDGARDGAAFLRSRCRNATILEFYGGRGVPLPSSLAQWSGDYIISYLAPWVIPADVLAQARIASINFHPGPPSYPGIGCTNFALYNGETEFGITCHHMSPKVDSGEIIEVRRFPIDPQETVLSLTMKCYREIAESFHAVAGAIVAGETLPKSSERWTRQPYTRRELNELCRLDPSMSKDEMERRIRATTFPGAPGAYVDVNGLRFEYRGG